MQFTKIFSVIAIAATGVHALPEPIPVGPVSAGGNYSLVTDAASKVIIGATVLSDQNQATVKALVATVVESAQSDAAAAAASITVIIGGTKAYADALTTILTTFAACFSASA